MKKQNNHISDEQLSKYFDDEVSQSEQEIIGEHFNECQYCRARLKKFQQLHTIAQKSGELEPERDLWLAIENQMDLLDKEDTNPLAYKKWATAAVIILIVLSGGWWLMDHPLEEGKSDAVAITSVNQFAFDYGLYLSGLENPEIMQRFNEGYSKHTVEAAEMVDSTALPARFSLADKLPEGMSVISTYLLESACCQCNQFTLEHDGQQITVFQQPQKHPAEFTGYHKQHAKIDSADCSRVDAGEHTALTFDAGDSKYVVVGKKNDPMLTTVMHRLSGH